MIISTSSIFLLDQGFHFLVENCGSLSSHITTSCGVALLRILRIVLLKMSTFSLMLVFKKALCQLNSLIAHLMSSVLASL